jgi:RNA polymerase sigma-70 factor (ECF subfamily)
MQLAVREDDIVARARARDEASIREIIRRHNRRLYRIARSILRDDSEAEDVLQETYIKAFTHLSEFRGDSSLDTWLCRIAMNEALGRLRRRRKMTDLSAVEEERQSAEVIRLHAGSPEVDPERRVAQHEIRQLLEEAIDRLPEEFRVVLIARAVEDMSVDETASALGLNPETVKTRLHRARQRLRAMLEARVGTVLQDVFPFEDPRCVRIADAVVARLGIAGV